MHGDLVNLQMLAAWVAGSTLVEIAADHGMSKQAVHQRIRRVARPADRQAARRAQADRRRREREAAEAAEVARRAREAARQGRTCPICGGLVLNPSRRTDSPECAEAWLVLRRSIDPAEHQRHRLAIARTYLRNPSRYSEAKVAWARRMVSDNPPPPNRRYRHRDSAVSRVLRERRP